MSTRYVLAANRYTYPALNRWAQSRTVYDPEPPIPLEFDAGLNPLRLNNYLFVDVGEGQSTGDKIR